MLFCREFENVVNRAFLVLIFFGGKLVGANFYAFCNYGPYLCTSSDQSSMVSVILWPHWLNLRTKQSSIVKNSSSLKFSFDC